MKFFFLLCLSTCFTSASCQSVKKNKVTEDFIEREFKAAEANETQDYVLWDEKLVLPNKDVAIKVAEPILFLIYGEKDILGQKPYNALLRENKWIITGTVHSTKGGSFLLFLTQKILKSLE